ncbi:hypothetical protein F5B17DRAFT_451806 [Nemania serpens]|nr:hypothetical protein F5B17DRAFT_451806 [Nemania serpens]
MPYQGPDISDSLPESQPSPSWHRQKLHLSKRFEFDRSSTIDNREPESSRLSDRQGTSSQALVVAQGNSSVDIASFSQWAGDHAKEYSGRAKVTDLARRFRHNLRDFTALLHDYEELRRMPSHWPVASAEDLYQQGHTVRVMFERTISVYRGPFTPKKNCSRKAWAKSRELFELMFHHDYEKLDGLLWHIVHWIAECHRNR